MCSSDLTESLAKSGSNPILVLEVLGRLRAMLRSLQCLVSNEPEPESG